VQGATPITNIDSIKENPHQINQLASIWSYASQECGDNARRRQLKEARCVKGTRGIVAAIISSYEDAKLVRSRPFCLFMMENSRGSGKTCAKFTRAQSGKMIIVRTRMIELSIVSPDEARTKKMASSGKRPASKQKESVGLAGGPKLWLRWIFHGHLGCADIGNAFGSYLISPGESSSLTP
jgi:hypothetical protein